MDFETKVQKVWLPEKPSLSLPKGGGAIRGLGEKFQVNSSTGTGTFAIPIELSSARALTPSLALQYDSSKGNTPFGLGWDVGVSAIHRKTEKALPKYDDEDIFLLSGSEELIPISKRDKDGFSITRYRPRVEASFARIERWKNVSTQDSYWQVTTQDNVTSIYGKDPFKRMTHPDDPSKIFQWLLEKTYDDKGNSITYQYKSEDLEGVDTTLASEQNRSISSNRYLKKISYGTTKTDSYLFHVVFDYGEHLTKIKEDRKWSCRKDPFSSYRSGFEIRTYRLCQRILLFHEITTQAASLIASVDLSYQETPSFALLNQIARNGYAEDGSSLAFSPITFSYSKEEFSNNIQTLEPESLENLPTGIQPPTYQWVDLYQEGLSGVLVKHENSWYYKRNYGRGNLGRLQPVPRTPSFQTAQEQITALAGEGRPCLVQHGTSMPGYFPMEGEEWGPFIPFAHSPNIDWNDPHLKQVDLTGDGFPDLLLSKEEVWAWYPSLGKEGFGPEVKLPKSIDDNEGPILVFAFEGQAIYFADMSGDGLADLVWIENGAISYWPNLGYGYFGAKVVMDNSPVFDHPDQFDSKRLRLGDLNGNGTTDILYLGREDISYWLNQAGNSWSSKKTLPFLPMDNLSSVAVFDLLGTGTGCLVWSSSLEGAHPLTLKYIDLLNSKKPYLLNTVDNQIGTVTHVEYTPSTLFYADDLLKGRLWKTKLPFPMHLVSQITIEDKVSGQQFTTHYTYHDGYYDLQEREFRGFGFVETIDDDPNCNPILKKAWFHLGIDIDQTSDYYRIDERATPLLSPPLPSNLTPLEEREARRSLKGRPLREEIFTSTSNHPYLVTEYTHQVRLLYPKEDRPYPVFLPLSYETRESYYEKTPHDPRITYEVILEIDTWGHPLKTLHIAYKRRLQSEYEEQQKNHTTATFYAYTLPTDTTQTFLGPLIAETKTYEVHNPEGKTPSLEDLTSFPELRYDEPLTTPFQMRLIEAIKYRYADKTGLLPFGQVGKPVLPGQTLQMAFPDTLIASIFGDKVTSSDLVKAGYIQDLTDKTWWTPSDQIECDFDNFYLPIRFQDPFGNTHHITYDPYALKAVSLKDPLGNTATAEYDYRVLQPIRTIDFNDNSAEAAYNALGLLIVTAVKGKNGEGDTLDITSASSDPLNELPENLLGNATTRIHYQLDQTPIFTYVLTREKHLHQLQPGEPPRIIKSVAYTDGFGRLVQTKASAPDNKWIVSGWTIYNRRGLPIQKYEPLFHDSPHFNKTIAGFSSTLYYDSKDRPVATRFPNETYEKTTFDSWTQTHWDPNNTLEFIEDPDVASFFTPNRAWVTSRTTLEEKEAAEQTKSHHDVSTTTYLDTLGRPFLVIKKDHRLHTTLDIEGNTLALVDALDRTISKSQYDMSSHALHVETMDAGESWTFLDVMGKTVRTWDIEGHVFETVYDTLHRPIIMTINGVVDETITYGESLPLAKDKNLLGKVIKHTNTSGTQNTLECDFKGNILKNNRQIGDELFTFETTYDALNHVTSQVHPDKSVTLQTYDDAGHLDTVTFINGTQPQPIVKAITYNAKAQWTSITYGNEIITTYEYDKLTDRLSLLQTKKAGSLLQDQTYTYDPVGNITHIYDRAQPTLIRDGVEIKPIIHYTYDEYYRLKEATGREHITALQPTEEEGPLFPSGHQNDLNALRPYTEKYTYDLVGNFKQMTHHASQADWTRKYTYFSNSNRLQSTTLPGNSPNLVVTYAYDKRGNMTQMPHLKQMSWDAKNHLIEIENQNQTKASYTYDSSGQRVKKIVVLAEGLQEERLYLGNYEIFRRTQAGQLIFERKTLHLMDGTKRVALFEVSSTETRLRFQLTNHLNSSLLELDEKGVEISYEEYHPFGSTALRTGLPKRYRYNGKEKDEETSLYYYGARYYASWLGRWTSPDPAGFVDGPNLYAYVKNNPASYSDPTGHFGWSDVKNNWKTIAITAAVIAIGVGVTIATAGIGTAIIGAGAASSGAGALAIGLTAGATGSVASGLVGKGMTGGFKDQTGGQIVKDILVDATIGAVSGGAGAGTALKLAKAAAVASTTSRVAKVAKVAGVSGASGAVSSGAGELTRQVVSGEKIDGVKIATKTVSGFATGAVIGGAVTAVKLKVDGLKEAVKTKNENMLLIRIRPPDKSSGYKGHVEIGVQKSSSGVNPKEGGAGSVTVQKSADVVMTGENPNPLKGGPSEFRIQDKLNGPNTLGSRAGNVYGIRLKPEEADRILQNIQNLPKVEGNYALFRNDCVTGARSVLQGTQFAPPPAAVSPTLVEMWVIGKF